MAPVGDLQPGGQLGVEIVRAGEHTAGQEAGLQVTVRSLDQALRFRVPGPAKVHPDGEQARERGELAGQASLADSGFVVPDQHLRHRLPGGQQPPVGVDQIARLP
ncbi:hypothetical protein HEK616_06600 [Streptomyces nigrescens]|uniref:Uncharacterized protein n=1 Tax=Streptomyces nigrescens TaxID=1920 RepID=A0ABM7ZL87_STRNI|nr:hypothetical protein HEK616_06600 [Streptomyces nigrescens]